MNRPVKAALAALTAAIAISVRLKGFRSDGGLDRVVVSDG